MAPPRDADADSPFGIDRGEQFPSPSQVLQEAIVAGAFPGSAFGIARGGTLRVLGSAGRFTYAGESPAVSPDTAYDLASVSKVLATTAVAMVLYQRGELQLDATLRSILPSFRDDRVTLRMLLAHASGLPAIAPLHEHCQSPAEGIAALYALHLEAEPGMRAMYSDPGFLLLGLALEAITGRPLDRLAHQEVFLPLGMLSTRYRPDHAMKHHIPPSEEKQARRKGTIQGEVHDENCWMLGGVCGHAGLFAPPEDVLRFAEALLAPLHGREPRLFTEKTVRTFVVRANTPPGSSRALGWDTPSGNPSSAGTLLSAASFGHLGFTGTSLWCDSARDLAVVLLTNRTYPTRTNEVIRLVRPRFHDAVVRQYGNGTFA